MPAMAGLWSSGKNADMGKVEPQFTKFPEGDLDEPIPVFGFVGARFTWIIDLPFILAKAIRR